MRYLSRCLCIVALLAFLVSCSADLSFLKRKTEDLVAEVGEDRLYFDDLNRNLNFKGLNEGDSLLLVDAYVKNWISEKVLYNKAKEEIDDVKEIDSLVENYRRSLVVYEYELGLVNEHLSQQISEAQLRVFYKENPSLFVLTEPLVKGMLLVAYSDVPDLQVLQSLMFNPSADNLDLISSVSVKNAAKFDYFSDNWVLLSEVQKKSPLQIREKDLQNNHLVEVADSMHTAFLYVQEFKPSGDPQPFEYAQARIRSILTEQNKNEFLRGYRKKMYESAIQNGQAKRYK